MENGQKILRIRNKKFIYLISPNKILNNLFYNELNLVLKSKKVKFFQLRLKYETIKSKVAIAKKILKICDYLELSDKSFNGFINWVLELRKKYPNAFVFKPTKSLNFEDRKLDRNEEN